MFGQIIANILRFLSFPFQTNEKRNNTMFKGSKCFLEFCLVIEQAYKNQNSKQDYDLKYITKKP